MKINFKKIGRRLLRILALFLLLVLFAYVFLYIKQERFFFNPKVLDKDYIYHFDQPFEEINIPVEEDVNLNALLFPSDSISKGVILYFHGNAGALHEWGERAYIYTENNYDVLFVDYRGYGKSDSFYEKEAEIYNDAQKVYDYVLTRYKEEDIIILGFSIGTGFATYAASKNTPKLLILEAPYYSWNDLISNMGPIPEWLIDYEIPSYKFLADVSCPIQVFHGSKDFIIDPDEHSKRLKDLYPHKINRSLIKGAGHSVHLTKQYYDELKELLNNY
ncbi:alpha/beta hydrolase [Seonamhaeicola marinus]|uniref:Alpha/beta hydrolase n=1 Tax=Seonamhaeicola marinus TaxID=1912246 RepID=A0A5D0JGL2_9FLAO|nr:alpha/beta fold hydrolase [Seonamhaeicola marinus]TYA94766.1 alpha/beta hydrolase [Seonamhaeicola marinus]